jgi:hypothetical protein
MIAATKETSVTLSVHFKSECQRTEQVDCQPIHGRLGNIDRSPYRPTKLAMGYRVSGPWDKTDKYLG